MEQLKQLIVSTTTTTMCIKWIMIIIHMLLPLAFLHFGYLIVIIS